MTERFPLRFASGGPVRSSLLGSKRELYALYSRRERHGIGAGRAVFSGIRTIDRRERLGVWVLDVNPALQFYEHLAGTRVATDKVVLRQETVTGIGLSWSPILQTHRRRGHDGRPRHIRAFWQARTA